MCSFLWKKHYKLDQILIILKDVLELPKQKNMLENFKQDINDRILDFYSTFFCWVFDSDFFQISGIW